ncbi:MAG: TrkA C-terminal domain-containing protein, partial [Candidatus Omnitrophota bacterium]
TAVILGKAFHFDPGTTAGIIGGALTQSSVIGTADGAITHLLVPAAQKTTMESNVAISYAITYIFGVAGLIIFYKLVPRILRINLKDEAKKLEKEMSGVTDEAELATELFSWRNQLNLRAYKVTSETIKGKTVSEIEKTFPLDTSIDRIKRGLDIIDPKPDTVIQSGDIIALVGRREAFIKTDTVIGPEVDDKDVVGLIGEMLKICVLNPDAVGKTLDEIDRAYGHGISLRKLSRQGHDMPLTKNTVVDKCDVFYVAGVQKRVERLVKYLGYPERPTVATDLIMVGIGCVLGTLLGLAAVTVFGIPLTLGIGGGVLLSGLVCGWLRSVHPTFGQIPGGAQWIFTDFGLNLFIACVGLIAGPKALDALKTTGASIFIAGVILTLVPHIFGILFGRVVLKMNPVLLFGGLTGAGTATPALNALKESSDSSLPALGFTIPYAFGNFILTIWGTLIVHLV